MTEFIPQSRDEFSAEWLTHVLCERRGAPRVERFEFGAADSGTTGRAELLISYAEPCEMPGRLFVKLPPDDPMQRTFVTETGMGRREALFYRHLASEVPVRVPHCYFADSDAAGERYVMLLEDLATGGCTFRNASTRYSVDYVRHVLGELARLHGRYWNSPRFDTDLDWVESPRRHEMGAILVEKAVNEYAGQMPVEFAELGELYVNRAVDIHGLWNQGVPTLVHGDIHDGNMFYDPELQGGTPGMLDWAIVGRTSCMRDVGYFMAGTLTPDDRREHQQALLDYYLQCLVEQGVTPPPLDELMQQYRWHIAYVWVGAVTTLAMGSEWQALSYVMNTLQRLNEAIRECDCIEALRESL